MSLSIGCTDWHSGDIQIGDDKGRKYVMYAFGRTAKTTLVTLVITGFCPCGYIEIPEDCKLSDASIKSVMRNFMCPSREEVEEGVPGLPYYAQKSLKSLKIVRRNRFRGFDANTSRRYLRVECESRQAIRQVAKLFQKDVRAPGDTRGKLVPHPVNIPGITRGGARILPLFEFGIDPLLRFFHMKNLQPASWIQISKRHLRKSPMKTKAKLTFAIDWNFIRPLLKPPCETPWVTASFDIECLSSHGDFPQAVKDYRKPARDLVELVEGLPRDQLLTRATFRVFLHEWFLGTGDEQGCPISPSHLPEDRFANGWRNIHGIFTKHGEKPNRFQINTLVEQLYPIVFENRKSSVPNRIYRVADIMNGVLSPRVRVAPDRVVQIGTSFWRYGESKPYRHTMITLGECSPIENVDVVSCKTEASLLQWWHKIMTQEMPDILTGYNIFGFDIPYLYKRAEDEGVLEQVFSLSRFQDVVSELKTKQVKGIGGALVEQEYVETPGMVQLDLMKIMQRDHNLDSYKLDNVAATFLRGKVKAIMGGNHSRGAYIESNSVAGLEPGNSVSLRATAGYVEESWGKPRYEVERVDHSEGRIYLSSSVDLKQKIPDDLVWCMGKNDVGPQDIFRLCKGTADEQCIVAKYCIQDVVLVIHLMKQLQVLPNNVAMGNVCSVPFGWIVSRGQGVKIQSLVAKQCDERGFLLPDLDKSKFGQDTFEGAIVLPPIPGMYLEEPVAVLDYASLYPSSMISMNLSHESYCDDPKWQGESGAKRLEELGYEYEDITYDTFSVNYTPSGLVKEKVKTGVKTVRFVQEPKGIIPQILENLLAARKETRTRMKHKSLTLVDGSVVEGIVKETDDAFEVKCIDKTTKTVPKGDVKDVKGTYTPFQKEVMDGQQLAYKITANSLYGQIGARTSYIYWKDIAAATTATGRKQLEIAQTYCEDHTNFPQKLDDGRTIYLKNKVVYGDSVTAETPILLRDRVSKQVNIMRIDELGDVWDAYNEFKPFDTNRKEKEQAEVEYDVWTDGGWSRIRRVIRHKTPKSIYRVLTHTGMVDVTEDHSLLTKDKQLLKSKDVKVGCELLHSYPSFSGSPLSLQEINQYEPNTIEEKRAYLDGMFFGDGSCGKYESKWGIKYSWCINNQDYGLLQRLQLYMKDVYGLNSCILQTMQSSGVYKLVPLKTIKLACNMFRMRFYNSQKEKVVPTEYLNASIGIVQAFICGYYAADGYRTGMNVQCSNKGQQGSAQLNYMFRRMGYTTSVYSRDDKVNVFKLTMSLGKNKSSHRKNPIAVKKVWKLCETGDSEFVYDIETESGVFQAGIGDIIVKNTDSVFVKYDCRHSDGTPMTGRDALKRSIDLGCQSEEGIQKLLKNPQRLEYEKTFWPFMLFTKKRYVGDKYEFDPNKSKRTSMGIVLKRRDNAPIVKVLFGGVIDTIMETRKTKKALDQLQRGLYNLIRGKFDISNLIITKTLAPYYKRPETIAHKILADRMAERDPGNAPQVNDRIPYIHIKIKKAKSKIKPGENIEHPEYIKQEKMEVDYGHYISNQIMKPVSQIFALAPHLVPGSRVKEGWLEDTWDKFEKSGYSREEARKKAQDESQKIIQHALFDDIMITVRNTEQRQQEITKWFPVVS